MHRFYLPRDHCRETTFSLPEREAHHALHVLRLRPGDRIVVLDGVGGEIDCEVIETGREQARVQVVTRKTIPALPFQITLLQAVPKGKIIESIVQKATELGVHRVVPLLSERSILRLEPQGAGRKTGKWQQMAIEAIKQCGSAWLPKVESPMTPQEFLERQEKFELPLVASLYPGSRCAREYFQKFQAAHSRKPLSVSIWVGPEGDFTPAEVSAIQGAGALPITLGPVVLRSETAAIFCLSILNYELQAHP